MIKFVGFDVDDFCLGPAFVLIKGRIVDISYISVSWVCLCRCLRIGRVLTEDLALFPFALCPYEPAKGQFYRLHLGLAFMSGIHCHCCTFSHFCQ